MNHRLSTLLLTLLLALVSSGAASLAAPNAAAAAAVVLEPTNGQRVSGTAVRIRVQASSSGEPALFLDGVHLPLGLQNIDADSYIYNWDTSKVSNGIHELRAGDSSSAPTSAPISITVANNAPTVRLTSPGPDSTLSGSVALAAEATADSTASATLQKVEFLVNGDFIGNDFSAPYTVPFDTNSRTDGTYSFTAVAYDSQGLITRSTPVRTTIKNSTTTAILEPTNGQRVSGTAVRIRVQARSSGEPALFLDGVHLPLGLQNIDADSYIYNWDTSKVSNGIHELRAGDSSSAPTSAPISITVANNAPTVRLTSPGPDSTLSGSVALAAEATADSTASATLQKVEFLVNGDFIGNDFSAPYTVPFDTNSRTDGTYSFTAVAYDSQGLITRSTPVRTTIKNSTTTAILEPTNGQRVSGTAVRIRVQSADTSGSAPELFFDGVHAPGLDPTFDENSRSWLYVLDFTEVDNGEHELRAGDDASAPTSAAVRVSVQNVVPSVSLSSAAISAGQRVTVTYRGAPGAVLDIYSKTQPATAYTRIAGVTLDGSGFGQTTHAPQRNTRIVAAEGSLESGNPLIQVRSVASFNAQRIGSRTYTFTGRVFPALSNRLVNVYRDGALVAQARSDASGIYRVTRTLRSGTSTFQARTGNDTYNLGTSSTQRRFAVS